MKVNFQAVQLGCVVTGDNGNLIYSYEAKNVDVVLDVQQLLLEAPKFATHVFEMMAKIEAAEQQARSAE